MSSQEVLVIDSLLCSPNIESYIIEANSKYSRKDPLKIIWPIIIVQTSQCPCSTSQKPTMLLNPPIVNMYKCESIIRISYFMKF